VFLPDRVLDFLDLVSFGLGVGYGFDIHRQITCYFHVPALGIYRSFNFINWYYKRNLCWCIRKEEEAGLFDAVIYRSEFRGSGTGWNEGRRGSGEKSYSKRGLASADDDIHHEGFRDPWAIGLAYGPAILSPRVEIEIHPVELADFVVGLVTFGLVDISEDDLATPRMPENEAQ